MENIAIIKKGLELRAKLIGDILSDANIVEQCNLIATQVIESVKNGGKVLFCGNGGSAADAQHLAAELSGKFYLDREPLHAEALHVNSSYLTAVSNDYSFVEVYSRLVKAKGVKGDVLVALSTSGKSENILKALEQAKISGLKCFGMAGLSGGDMHSKTDILIKIPSLDTAIIQEGHLVLGHLVCQIVEENLFRDAK